MEDRSRKLVTNCSKGVGGGNAKTETIAVPSKLGKDPIESFTRQRGSSRFGSSILTAAG